MSIVNYSTLKDAIANFLKRSDLTARIPELVVLAEGMIAVGSRDTNGREIRGLRSDYNYCRVTASVSTEYMNKPTNFLQMGNFQLNTTPIQRLGYLSKEMMDIWHPESVVSRPQHYTFHGKEIHLKPIADTTYTAEMSYWYRLAKLSDDGDTNDVLINFPGVYLYAALASAEALIKNDKRIATWQKQYVDLVERINDTTHQANHSGSKIITKPRRIPE